MRVPEQSAQLAARSKQTCAGRGWANTELRGDLAEGKLTRELENVSEGCLELLSRTHHVLDAEIRPLGFATSRRLLTGLAPELAGFQRAGLKRTESDQRPRSHLLLSKAIDGQVTHHGTQPAQQVILTCQGSRAKRALGGVLQEITGFSSVPRELDGRCAEGDAMLLKDAREDA